MSLSAITIKILFLSSLLISLRCESVNGVSCTKTNIFACGDCLVDMPIGLIDIPIELADIFIELVDMSIEVI